MVTTVDVDGTLCLNENHMFENIMVNMTSEEQERGKLLYKQHRIKCAEILETAESVEDFIDQMAKSEKEFLIQGAMLFKGKPVKLITETELPKANPHVLRAACSAVGNGGLRINTLEDERAAKQILRNFGLTDYELLCNRLAENNGQLTGSFERIVGVKERMYGYGGGTVYEDGLSGIGVIAKAVAGKSDVYICGRDELLKATLKKFGLVKSVKYLE